MDDFASSIAVGVVGYSAARLPGVLFPAHIPNGTGVINNGRNWTHMQLDSVNRNPMGHFISTSLRDNLGFVLFLLNFTGRSLRLSLPRNSEASLTLATFAVVSCSIMHLGRAAAYQIGNRIVDRFQGDGVPPRAVTIARTILAALAPSEL